MSVKREFRLSLKCQFCEIHFNSLTTGSSRVPKGGTEVHT